MPDKFSAIVCPQCGSSSHTYLGDDRYQCTSCNTIFLENKEKIEVHVKHSYNNPPDQPAQITSKAKKAILLACILVPIALTIFSVVGSKLGNKNPNRSLLSADVYDMVNGANQAVEVNGRLQYLVPVYRHGRDDGRECLTIKTFDPQTKKLQGETMVMPWMSAKEFSSKGYEEFKTTYLDHSLYLYVSDKLYAIAANTMVVKDKSAELASKFPALTSGIAKVELLYGQERGFKLHSNDGLNYYYFPRREQVYNEQDYLSLRSKLSAGLKPETVFEFKGDERQELFSKTVIMDAGGPNGNCTECTKSEHPFTPGRIYFNGDVPYKDADHVVIVYKADAGEKTGRVVQCLDKTGAIQWTTPAISFAVKQWKYPFDTDASGFVTKNNVLCLNTGICAIAIDMADGKILWQVYYSEDEFRESVK